MAKTGITQSSDPGVVAFFHQVSHDTLVDVVIDLLRQEACSENLNGPALIERFKSEAGPIVRIRGAKLPASDYWERQLLKWHKSTGDDQRKADIVAALNGWRPGYLAAQR